MTRLYYMALLIGLVAIVAIPTVAQAPSRAETQPLVIQDMSERVGVPLTINSMSYQQWYFGSYQYVTSLGCELAPASPPTTGNWQRFEFTYDGFIYIYVVSENLQSLILCDEPDIPTPIPSMLPTATQTTSSGGQTGGGSVTTVACPLPTRLIVGGRGQVTEGDPNWVHREANRNSEKISEIAGGDSFTVVNGPVCDRASGMNYWYVEYGVTAGWTSEGLNGDYWLEPINNMFNVQTIAQASIVELDWITDIIGDAPALIALSESPAVLAIAIAIEDTVTVYDQNGTPITAIVAESNITVLEFSFLPTIVFGTETGQVGVITIGDTELTLNYQHNAVIRAMTLNNELLVVVDENGTLIFWDRTDDTAPLRVLQLPEPAYDLEFSSDNSVLVVRDVEGRVITLLASQ